MPTPEQVAYSELGPVGSTEPKKIRARIKDLKMDAKYGYGEARDTASRNAAMLEQHLAQVVELEALTKKIATPKSKAPAPEPKKEPAPKPPSKLRKQATSRATAPARRDIAAAYTTTAEVVWQLAIGTLLVVLLSLLLKNPVRTGQRLQLVTGIFDRFKAGPDYVSPDSFGNLHHLSYAQPKPLRMGAKPPKMPGLGQTQGQTT